MHPHNPTHMRRKRYTHLTMQLSLWQHLGHDARGADCRADSSRVGISETLQCISKDVCYVAKWTFKCSDSSKCHDRNQDLWHDKIFQPRKHFFCSHLYKTAFAICINKDFQLVLAEVAESRTCRGALLHVQGGTTFCWLQFSCSIGSPVKAEIWENWHSRLPMWWNPKIN